jgi:TolB protein
MESFTYAYWSPADCAAGANCRDLAVLLSSQAAGGFIVELVRHEGDTLSNDQVGTGAPFYFSWSPDGSRMLWQRNNSRLDIYDVENGGIAQALDQQPGAFFAPAWSPVDDRFAFGELNEARTTDLVVLDGDVVTRLAQNIEGLVSFSWSTDSTNIAYVSPREPLRVVNSETGEEISHSSDIGILAFFWSPDATKIAYLTLEVPPGSFSAKGQLAKPANQQDSPARVVWSIFDVETAEIRRFSPYVPTRDMVYLLTYYDQFSQSHRVWSPDSRYVLYSEITTDGDPAIQAIDSLNSSGTPMFIAEGTLGIWSFD